MSLVNKKGDMTPFDMRQKPCRQNALLLPFVWGASFAATRQFHLKIRKVHMEGLKPPYLVLSTHQGFSDYYIAPLALFPHRANYVSDMEGFAAFGKWLYRGAGCLGKRRYVSDVAVMKNILHVLRDNNDILVLFPESRHSNVGTTSLLPDNLGKLCKFLQVPVVTLQVHGSYLANPFWDEAHTRKTPMEATLACLCTSEELARLSAEEVQRRVEEKLAYDETAWQKAQGIRIRGERLAEGLQKALYQCRNCGAQHGMTSCGNTLRCTACGATWQYTEWGELVQGDAHIQIPEWYEWERQNVIDAMRAGEYSAQFCVQVEALPNEKGFVPLGDGTLCHTAEGFTLAWQGTVLHFSAKRLESVQTEYDYRKRGPCIVLSTRDCCYYVYSADSRFCPTKLQFAAEYAHQMAKSPQAQTR